MSDGVVSDRFQTRGGNELSSHTTKDYLRERTVASLKHSWQSLCRCPALTRDVIVKVDDQPVKNWREAMEKLLGPGEHLFSESDMSGGVLAPNESMTVVTPCDPNNNPLAFYKSNPLWVTMNKERFRLTAEICYSSTLGECSTLRSGGLTSGTTAGTCRCPTPSAITSNSRTERRLTCCCADFPTHPEGFFD